MEQFKCSCKWEWIITKKWVFGPIIEAFMVNPLELARIRTREEWEQDECDCAGNYMTHVENAKSRIENKEAREETYKEHFPQNIKAMKQEDNLQHYRNRDTFAQELEQRYIDGWNACRRHILLQLGLEHDR